VFPRTYDARIRRAALAAALSLALAGAPGCAAARRPYVAPAPKAPDAWSRSAGASAGPVDADRVARWWTAFNDSTLTALVQRAVTGNLDVKTAMSRVRESRASLESTRGNRLPTVDAAGNASFSRGSRKSMGDVPDGQSVDLTSARYRLGLDASWELDVFGRQQSAIDVAGATAAARDADLQDVVVTLAGDVATQYITVRELQQRIRLGTANAKLQEDAYDLTRFRAQAGLTTTLDVEQARVNLESTRSQLAALERQRATSTHALALLLGDAPTALDAELAVDRGIPAADVNIAVGLPAETIRRRPDVRSAERQLAAQAAQVNVTTADLYPRFSLSGSIGLETIKLASLFVPGATAISGGPSASWRIFDRRQIKQNILVQQERETQAALAYESTVLRALQEVEDALVGLAQDQVTRAHLAEAVDAAGKATDLSLALYRSGVRDFRDVLDAQRSLTTAQDQLASSTANVSLDVVRVYKAIGGDWAATSLVTGSR
jgi:NodT family efflux transporter outer membrane factor (OMF) lipoprotein